MSETLVDTVVATHLKDKPMNGIALYYVFRPASEYPQDTVIYRVGRAGDEKIRVQVSVSQLMAASDYFRKELGLTWRTQTKDIVAEQEPRIFLLFMRILHRCSMVEEGLMPEEVVRLATIVDFYLCTDYLYSDMNSILMNIQHEHFLGYGHTETWFNYGEGLHLGIDVEMVEDPELDTALKTDGDRSIVETQSSDTVDGEDVDAWGCKNLTHMSIPINTCLERWVVAAYIVGDAARFKHFTHIALLHWRGAIQFTTEEGQTRCPRLQALLCRVHHDVMAEMVTGITQMIQVIGSRAIQHGKPYLRNSAECALENLQLWPLNLQQLTIMDAIEGLRQFTYPIFLPNHELDEPDESNFDLYQNVKRVHGFIRNIKHATDGLVLAPNDTFDSYDDSRLCLSKRQCEFASCRHSVQQDWETHESEHEEW